MMNNKGFTLVETLGVIALIAIIGVIATNSFSKNVEKTESAISDSQKKSILNAAEMWSVENTYLLERYDNSQEAQKAAGAITGAVNSDNITMCVTTNYLYNKGYINTKDIKLENNEKFSGYIIITFDNKTNQYKFRLATTDKEVNSCKNNLVVSD